MDLLRTNDEKIGLCSICNTLVLSSCLDVHERYCKQRREAERMPEDPYVLVFRGYIGRVPPVYVKYPNHGRKWKDIYTEEIQLSRNYHIVC